jgi:uncharacterized protein (DUF1778 family)
MIENIKTLYGQLDDKTTFIETVAKEVGKKVITVRTHWFCRYFAIPDEYQERVVELLQNTIKNQNEIKQSVAYKSIYNN